MVNFCYWPSFYSELSGLNMPAYTNSKYVNHKSKRFFYNATLTNITGSLYIVGNFQVRLTHAVFTAPLAAPRYEKNIFYMTV